MARLLTLVALTVASAGTSLLAAPIVDGDVTPADAYYVAFDTPGEVTYPAGFDIDALHYFQSDDSLFFGLEVVGGAIDFDGGQDPWEPKTRFTLKLYDGQNGPLFRNVVVTSTSASSITATLYDGAGSFLTILPVSDVDGGPDLELRIPDSLLEGIPYQPYFRAWLDNSAEPADDMVSGVLAAVVPEPATLSVLGLGGLALLRRRR